MSTPGPDVAAFLDRLEAAHRAATTGEWSNPYPFTKLIDAPGSTDNLAIVQCDSAADAAAIVAAHNAMPALITALRGVLALADAIDYEAERLDPPSRPTKRAVAADLRSVVTDALDGPR